MQRGVHVPCPFSWYHPSRNDLNKPIIEGKGIMLFEPAMNRGSEPPQHEKRVACGRENLQIRCCFVENIHGIIKG